MHRPEWTLLVLCQVDGVTVEDVQPLPGHPALRHAGGLLAKQLDADIILKRSSQGRSGRWWPQAQETTQSCPAGA